MYNLKFVSTVNDKKFKTKFNLCCFSLSEHQWNDKGLVAFGPRATAADVRVLLADDVGAALRPAVCTGREADGNGRRPPMESGRAVGDVQRTAQADTGAALPGPPAAGPVDAALRPTAQVAVRERRRRRRCGGFERTSSSTSVDPAHVVRRLRFVDASRGWDGEGEGEQRTSSPGGRKKITRVTIL